jgi:hypothetical protein
MKHLGLVLLTTIGLGLSLTPIGDPQHTGISSCCQPALDLNLLVIHWL